MAWDGRTVDDPGQGAMEWLTCPVDGHGGTNSGHGVGEMGGGIPSPA